jgi:hypothetical protein
MGPMRLMSGSPIFGDVPSVKILARGTGFNVATGESLETHDRYRRDGRFTKGPAVLRRSLIFIAIGSKFTASSVGAAYRGQSARTS